MHLAAAFHQAIQYSTLDTKVVCRHGEPGIPSNWLNTVWFVATYFCHKVLLSKTWVLGKFLFCSGNIISRTYHAQHFAFVAQVAGELAGKRRGLWAVVEAETADAVQAAWIKSQLVDGTTLPANQRKDRVSQPGRALTTQPTARATGSYHLVRYDGRRWNPRFAALLEKMNRDR